MHRTVTLLSTLLLIALPQQGLSEDLLSVYQQAQQNDPTIKAADAGRNAAHEIRKQARAALLPTLDLKASSSDIDVDTSGEYSSDQIELTLIQPLYRQSLYAGMSQGSIQAEQGEAQYLAAQQDLIIRVSEAYFNVLADIDNLTFAKAEKVATARQLEQTRQRFKVGLIAITDVHEAQARHDLVVAQEIAADNRLANSREALAEITAAYPKSLVGITDGIPLIEPTPNNINEWANQSKARNLSLVSTRYDADLAREEMLKQRGGHYPALDLIASRNKSDSDGGLQPGERETDTVTLQLTVPLFAGGGTHAAATEARYRYDQARHNLEQQERAVVRQTRNAYLGVIAGISQAKALKQALVSSRTALEATQAGFEVGTRTIVDVLDAQRGLHQAERDYNRALYDYILNTLRLKQAAGSLTAEELTLVNGWLK